MSAKSVKHIYCKCSFFALALSVLSGSLSTPWPPFSTVLARSPSLLTLTHSWCLCVSPWACTSPPCLSFCGWNISWGPVSNRLTGFHHSLAQKNRQHDGCASRWHLQPEPQYCFKSLPVSHLCFLCVQWLTNCKTLHVSLTHHSVRRINQVKPTHTSSCLLQFKCQSFSRCDIIRSTRYLWAQQQDLSDFLDTREVQSPSQGVWGWQERVSARARWPSWSKTPISLCHPWPKGYTPGSLLQELIDLMLGTRI